MKLPGKLESTMQRYPKSYNNIDRALTKEMKASGEIELGKL